MFESTAPKLATKAEIGIFAGLSVIKKPVENGAVKAKEKKNPATKIPR